MDIATLSTALSGIKAAMEIASSIRSGHQSLKGAELDLRLADLTRALAGATTDAAELQMALVAAQQRVAELEAEVQLKRSLKWKQPCYVRPAQEGGEDEAFCQPCLDKDNRLARLHHDGNGFYACYACNATFKTAERKAAERAAVDKARSVTAMGVKRRAAPW